MIAAPFTFPDRVELGRIVYERVSEPYPDSHGEMHATYAAPDGTRIMLSTLDLGAKR